MKDLKDLFRRCLRLFKRVRRLFVLTYIVNACAANDETDTKENKKYFLPRGEIKN